MLGTYTYLEIVTLQVNNSKYLYFDFHIYLFFITNFI